MTGTERATGADQGDLLALVRRTVLDAGLYQPGTDGLVISAVGDSVVVSWAESAPVPAVPTAVAIRTALLELMNAAGLRASYARAPGARAGTITVTRASEDCSEALPALA